MWILSEAVKKRAAPTTTVGVARSNQNMCYHQEFLDDNLKSLDFLALLIIIERDTAFYRERKVDSKEDQHGGRLFKSLEIAY